MAKLIYSTIVSLDGYTEDKDGHFDWGEPDEQVHTFVNDLWRSFGTYLYGRRMYEVMIYWETAHTRADQPAYIRDFARIWQGADKIVYSKTLEAVSSERTRIERDFNAVAISQMKTRATSDMTVGGAELATQALKAGLVDDCQLFVSPIAVRGGKPLLLYNLRVELELLNERRFDNGVIYLHYRIKI